MASTQTVPALGADIWDCYAQKPEEGAAFTDAMHVFTSGIVQEAARVVDTSTAKLAVDIAAIPTGPPARSYFWSLC